MAYEATQVEVEVKGKKRKAWAVVDEQGVVKRAYTSKMIGDPQGGAEAYAAELNAMLPPPPKVDFKEPTFGESFSHVEPHHLPEGFDTAAAFLLGLNWANLFDTRDVCKGCGATVGVGGQPAHHERHREQVRRLRAAGRAKVEPKAKDWAGIDERLPAPEGDPHPGFLAAAMRNEGASYREISEEFARRGIKTARGKDEWSTTAVMRLLR